MVIWHIISIYPIMEALLLGLQVFAILITMKACVIQEFMLPSKMFQPIHIQSRFVPMKWAIFWVHLIHMHVRGMAIIPALTIVADMPVIRKAIAIVTHLTRPMEGQL